MNVVFRLVARLFGTSTHDYLDQSDGQLHTADSGEREYSPGIVSGTLTTSGAVTAYASSGPAFAVRKYYALPVLRGLEEAPVITITITDSADVVLKTITHGGDSWRKKITGPAGGKVKIALDIDARVPYYFDIQEL